MVDMRRGRLGQFASRHAIRHAVPCANQECEIYLCPQAFELCESLNAVGAVLDLHKLLENRKALPESKMAVLEALGDISKAAGMYYTCVTACWTSLDVARQGKARRTLLI